MISAFNISLPTPEIPEELNLSFSHKNGTRKTNAFQHLHKPPKVWNKHESPSSSGGAHGISFMSEEVNLSSNYVRESKLSFYEQCFEQIKKLGEGSFGEVFKVRCKDDGKFYAIKKSKKYFRSESNRQKRLEEVKRYEQFSTHTHCVRFYKAWEEDDRLFVQMELCKGNMDDIARDYASKGISIPESLVWLFLLDLLLALKSLHDQNLIHLDIKLDNILVTDNNLCKLGDFGLIFDLSRKDISQAVEGDSRYLAPEILQGNFSKAADIFSLGVCVMELACNIELEANGPLWQKLREGVLPEEFLESLSVDLQNIIRWMMQPNPKDRPNVDNLLNHRKLRAVAKSRKTSFITSWKSSLSKRFSYITQFCLKHFLLALSWINLRPMKLNVMGESILNTSADQSEINTSQTTPTVSSSSIPNYSPIARIVNSTPLNSNGCTSRIRPRKDFPNLSRTLLGFDSDEDDDSSFLNDTDKSKFNVTDEFNEDSASLICKNLFQQNSFDNKI